MTDTADTQSDDERVVREAWERIHVCDGSYRDYDKGTILLQDVRNHWFDFNSWQAARAFTEERRKQIAEVGEEIK